MQADLTEMCDKGFALRRRPWCEAFFVYENHN